MTELPERFVVAASPDDRGDALAFLSRAIRLDEAAVIRVVQRSDGLLAVSYTHLTLPTIYSV